MTKAEGLGIGRIFSEFCAINNTLIQVTFNKDVEDIKASNITLSSGTVEGVTVSGKVASVKVKGIDFGQTVTVGVTGITGLEDYSKSVKVPSVNELYTLEMVSDKDTVKSDGLSKTMITVTLKEKATGETVKTDAVVQFTTTRGALAQPEVSFQNGSASVQLTSVASPTSVPAIVTAVIAEAPDAAQYIGLTNQKNITFSPDAKDEGTVTFVQAVGVQARQGDRIQVDFSGDITAADYKKAVLGSSTAAWSTLANSTAGTNAGINLNGQTVRIKDVRNVTPRTLEFILDTDSDATTPKGTDSIAPTTKRIDAAWTNANSTAKNYLRDNVEHTLTLPSDLGKLVRKNDGLKFVMADTSKPRVFGVEAKNQIEFDVRFSEAMAEDLVEGAQGAINTEFKIDGQAVRLFATTDATPAQVVTAKANNEIIVTELKVGNYDVAKNEDTRNIVSFKVHKDFKLSAGTHTVQVSNVGDWAGIVDKPANIVTTQTFDFTVTSDTNAPSPVVKVESPEQWKVSFGRKAESISNKLAKDAFVIYTNEGYGKNPKEALVMGTDFDVYKLNDDGYTGTLVNPNSPITAHDNFMIEFKQDWTKKLLSESTNVGYWHSTLNPFKIVFDNLESEYGVKMNEQIKDVTLTYDGKSPEIASAVDINTLDKKTANGETVTDSGQKILVKMDEPVQMPASTNPTPSEQQGNVAGIPVPTFEFVKGDKVVKGEYTGLAIDDQSFVVVPEVGKTLEAGNWTLYIRSISDDVGNTSATVSKVVTVPQTQATVTDTKIAWAAFDNDITVGASDYDFVYIKFTKPMKDGGANGVALTTNYVFQGNELPAGSEVLRGIENVTKDWDGVTIRMPKGTWNGLSSDFTSIVSVANNFVAADGEELSTPYGVEMSDTSNDSVNDQFNFNAFYGDYSTTNSSTRDAGIVIGTNVYPVVKAEVADGDINVDAATGKTSIETITVTLPVVPTGTTASTATGQEVLVNGVTYVVKEDGTTSDQTMILEAKVSGKGAEGTATSALKITSKNGGIIVNTRNVDDTAAPLIEKAALNNDKVTVTFSEAVTNKNDGTFEKLDASDFTVGGVTPTAVEHKEGTANTVVLTVSNAATLDDTSVVAVTASSIYDMVGNTNAVISFTGLTGATAATGITGLANQTTAGVAPVTGETAVSGEYTITLGNIFAAGDVFTIDGKIIVSDAGTTATDKAANLKTKIEANTDLHNKYTVVDNLDGTLTLTENSGYEDAAILTITTNSVAGTVAVNEDTEGKAEIVSSAGTAEVNKLTISGTATAAGNITVTFNDGGTPVVKTIAVANGETAASIASRLQTQFNTAITGWDVTVSGDDVVFTANPIAADKTVTITVSNS